eukprot:COSAG04_NODE_56_length_30604_cov_692.571119_26_plen_155_part_00
MEQNRAVVAGSGGGGLPREMGDPLGQQNRGLRATPTGDHPPLQSFADAPRLALRLADCTSDTLWNFVCTAGAETDEAGKIAGSVAAAACATAADVLPGAGLAPYPGGGGPCEGGGRAGVAEQATECASKAPPIRQPFFQPQRSKTGEEGRETDC